MGMKNQQRRAAKAKQRSKAHRGARSGGRSSWQDPPLTEDEVAGFAMAGAVNARLAGDGPAEAEMVAALSSRPPAVIGRAGEGELRQVLPLLWDGGWQPLEVARQGRRVNARAGRLITRAVLADHATRAPSTLDPRWEAQVEELSASSGPQPASGWVQDLLSGEGLDPVAATTAVVDALSACFRLGPIEQLLAPPGRAGPSAAGRKVPGADREAPVLAKVRALLAQAESTTFEAEAVAFTAKAQELMARYSLDHALVWERSGREASPVALRLPVDDPYAEAKSLLLQIVAERSGCGAVFHERYAMSTVVGLAADLASAEMLFTSLLVQSQMALQAESAAAQPGSRSRSRSFRSSFLLAYANRIDERLAAVNDDVRSDVPTATERSLLPVLAARSDAVDDAVQERFGTLASHAVRGGSDGVGWVRGRMAADRAQLTDGELPPGAGEGARPGPAPVPALDR
jgi:hypothetical protein